MSDEYALTSEERKRLNWCLEVLDEEHIVECHDEAEMIAYKEANASEAHLDLLSLLVKLRVHELTQKGERGGALR